MTNGTTGLARHDRAELNRQQVNHGEGFATGWDHEMLQLIKRTVAVGLNDVELAYFSRVCQATGLNPIQKQIYAYKFGQKLIIQTGVDGYRLIASRTGEYEGQTAPQWCGEDGEWVDAWLTKTLPAAARVGVYRKGFREPLVAVVTWAEFGGGSNENWKTRPAHMLAKTAEVHALRRAFPNETAGVAIAPDPDAAETGAPPEVLLVRAADLYPPDPVAQLEPINIRKLHAAGNERGLDHAVLHAMAVELYGIASLTQLTQATARDLYQRVMAQPLMPADTSPAVDTVELGNGGEL